MKWCRSVLLIFLGVVTLTINRQQSAQAQEIVQSERTHSLVQNALPAFVSLETQVVVEQLNSQCRQTGHMETVRAVAITPDGKTAVTGGDDATIRVWELKTGRERQLLFGHTSSIEVLQVSSDGTRVFSGSRDGTVRVWNLETGQLVYTFEHPPKSYLLGRLAIRSRDPAGIAGVNSRPVPIEAIAVSPDGQTLLSSDGFGNLKIWDLTTGQERSTLRKLKVEAFQKSQVLELKFTPDGRSLLIGSLERSLEQDSVSTHFPQDPILALIQKYQSSGQDVISVSRWEIATGQQIRTLEGIPLRRFKGRINWTAGYPLSNRERYSIAATAIVSPDGKYVVAETEEGLVVQDLETGYSRQLIVNPFASSSLSISPDSQTLIAANHQTITTWNLQTGQVLQVFHPPKTVHRLRLSDNFLNGRAVAISPDGKTAVSGGEFGHLSLWDLSAGQLNRQLSPPHREVRDVQVSADGNTIVALLHGDDVLVKRWDLATGHEQILSIRDGDRDDLARHITIAVSPNGKTLVTGHADGSAKVWNAVTGQKLLTLKSERNLGFAKVAISPDGKTLVKGISHGGLEFWDLQTAAAMSILETKNNSVSGVAISADSQTVATFDNFGSVMALWDIQTGQQLWTLKPENWLNSIAISPNSRWLVGGDQMGRVTLWDLQTTEELRTFNVTQSAVHSLAILPDGKTLVVGSGDRFIRLWDLNAGQQLQVLDTSQPAPIVMRSGFSLMFNPGSVLFRLTQQDSGSLLKLWQTVTALAISRDGKTLFSGSRDGDVKQWDLTTGRALKAFCGNSPGTESR